ncbi:MAG: hypothetical protein JSR78_20580 [Proteobacteria bacterium]|nr:hypothetical protein [Pseudomonadota bacterium]
MSAITEVLKEKARLLLLLSAFVCAMTYAVLSLIAPRYASESAIAVLPQGTSPPADMDPATIGTHIGVLQSPSMLQPVAYDLALAQQPEFNSALGPVDLFQAVLSRVGLDNNAADGGETMRVVGALQKSVEIFAANDRQAIFIRATSLDPIRSSNIANAIADRYAATLSQVSSGAQIGSYPAPDAPAPTVAHVISRAVPHPVPVYPNKIVSAMLAGFAVGLFGLAWIVVTTALRGLKKRPSAKLEDAPEPDFELTSETADSPTLEEVTASADLPAKPVIAPGPAVEANPPPDFTEIEKLAVRLKTRRPSGGGHRTLITSKSEDVVPYDQALHLASVLAGCGAQTILIDWSPSGEGFAKAVGLDAQPGFNDLLQGCATFNDIIHRLPGSTAQVIASGAGLPRGNRKMDANMLNLALDALDEVYDHIIVTGRHDEARGLFECIEGRFDAGVTIEPMGDGTASRDDGGTFLGFEVTDIDILHYLRPEPPVSSMAQRIAHATRSREAVAQRA